MVLIIHDFVKHDRITLKIGTDTQYGEPGNMGLHLEITQGK